MQWDAFPEPGKYVRVQMCTLIHYCYDCYEYEYKMHFILLIQVNLMNVLDITVF